MTLFTLEGKRMGKARISIDGEPAKVIDGYARRFRARVPHRFTGLGEGTHVLTISPLGRSHRRATDRRVPVDALRWGGRLHPDPRPEEVVLGTRGGPVRRRRRLRRERRPRSPGHALVLGHEPHAPDAPRPRSRTGRDPGRRTPRPHRRPLRDRIVDSQRSPSSPDSPKVPTPPRSWSSERTVARAAGAGSRSTAGS